MSGAEGRMTPVVLTWFPLVVRPRPPGLPLEARITELTGLAAEPASGTARERASRAAEVLNKAALIASDCGMPALARDLCHRQRALFDQATPLPGWAIRLALQPILNIPRQRIREGQGQDACAMLETLYQAARQRTSAGIDGQTVDLSAITRTPEDHKTVCTLIWAALLADGTRALALAGRWKEAADHAATHRGTGKRLLDGRQAAILALLHDGQRGKAADMVEQATITSPCEHAVQALLRVLCLHPASPNAGHHAGTMLAAARTVLEDPDRSTALARARIGMTALDLAPSSGHLRTRPLREALITTASNDGYVARDMLAHHHACQSLTAAQHRDLRNLVQASGLGAGTIPRRLHDQLMTAVDRAENTLNHELAIACSRPPPSRPRLTGPRRLACPTASPPGPTTSRAMTS
jgi:hypothetical protein